MIAIIIAAGNATRWGNYLNSPKHLIKIDGESLLERTSRLLSENGVNNIYIVGPDDNRYKITNTILYIPEKNAFNRDADKFLNSEDLWSIKERTLVLYGDVYFTEKAIKKIVDYSKDDWTLFARFHPSAYTGTKWGECFAQSFYPKDIPEHREMLLYIVELNRENIIKRCGGWEHYRAMNGAKGKDVGIHKHYGRVITIDDFTDDFDYPHDYDRFISNFWKKDKILFKFKTKILAGFYRIYYSAIFILSYFLSHNRKL